jgi:hypothetical protein
MKLPAAAMTARSGLTVRTKICASDWTEKILRWAQNAKFLELQPAGRRAVTSILKNPTNPRAEKYVASFVHRDCLWGRGGIRENSD